MEAGPPLGNALSQGLCQALLKGSVSCLGWRWPLRAQGLEPLAPCCLCIWRSEHRGDLLPATKRDWGWFNWKRIFNLLAMELSDGMCNLNQARATATAGLQKADMGRKRKVSVPGSVLPHPPPTFPPSQNPSPSTEGSSPPSDAWQGSPVPSWHPARGKMGAGASVGRGWPGVRMPGLLPQSSHQLQSFFPCTSVFPSVAWADSLDDFLSLPTFMCCDPEPGREQGREQGQGMGVYVLGAPCPDAGGLCAHPPLGSQ